MFPDTLTWKGVGDYVRSGKDLIVVPIGSLEGHGYHLPLNTDTIIAEEIACGVARAGQFVSLPAITYTIVSLARPGNVEVGRQTFKALVCDVVRSFVKFGIKRFIILLGHGGPEMKNSLEELASNLLSEKPELHISMLHISRIIAEVSSIDTTKDRHAGEWETSLMLHFRPEIVGEKRVKDFTFPSKHGVIGDPTIASKEKGEQLAHKTVDWISNWIGERTSVNGVYYNW